MRTPGAIYENFTEKNPAPVDGSLQVWWIPQVPGKLFCWRVDDLKQAALLLDVLAAYDDFQFAQNVKGDYCNMGGLTVWQDGQWEDWMTDEGDNFDDYRRRVSL